MILIIDNYDSFTYNLLQYVGEFDEVKVYRNDEITIDEIRKLNPKGIILSPGPKRPEDAGITLKVIKELDEEYPILGICLGHQAIGLAYGGEVVRCNEIFHGKSSKIDVKGRDIFEGIPRRIEVMRYHSLMVKKETLPKELEIIGQTEDGVIMALKHKCKEVYGLQFHPESIFTIKGSRILRNFVEGICYEN